MSYILRDLADGQVELVLLRSVPVGTFSDREVAHRVCTLLNDETPEVPDAEPPVLRGPALEVDAEAAVEVVLADMPAPKSVLLPARRSGQAPKSSRLPAVVAEKPLAPVSIASRPVRLTEAQREEAFARLIRGEKIAVVAPDFGLTMQQLRGAWAGHRRSLQAHIAGGGKENCRLCQTPFTPSISHPDTCARCSRG